MDRRLRQAMRSAIRDGDFDALSAVIRTYLGDRLEIIVRATTEDVVQGAMLWDADTPQRSLLWLRDLSGAAHRIDRLLPLIETYHASPAFRTGRVTFHIGDAARGRGLGFCSNDPETTLVPDVQFIRDEGYRDIRAGMEKTRRPWADRIGQVIWRGSASGPFRNTNWERRPRIVMVRTVKDHPLFDVGLSGVTDQQASTPTMRQELIDDGSIKGFVSPDNFPHYKYQIDIDGNTNSWAGLFVKLLTGSPVLKVASSAGYRQWYYDRLVPWQNFVPIAADCSDLIEKAEWLAAHDSHAREIGARSLELANDLDYRKELERAAPAIAQAMRAR